MLQNQHAVSVGKKSVPFPDSFQIGFHDQFLARESADKHQQRALRQMEIRDQGVHLLAYFLRTDENRCFLV